MDAQEQDKLIVKFVSILNEWSKAQQADIMLAQAEEAFTRFFLELTEEPQFRDALREPSFFVRWRAAMQRWQRTLETGIKLRTIVDGEGARLGRLLTEHEYVTELAPIA